MSDIFLSHYKEFPGTYLIFFCWIRIRIVFAGIRIRICIKVRPGSGSVTNLSTSWIRIRIKIRHTAAQYWITSAGGLQTCRRSARRWCPPRPRWPPQSAPGPSPPGWCCTGQLPVYYTECDNFCVYHSQCCGSGSAWILNFCLDPDPDPKFKFRIRIQQKVKEHINKTVNSGLFVQLDSSRYWIENGK